jgi:ribosome biogenesis GTPase
MCAVPAGLGRRPGLDEEIRALGEPGLTAARVLAQHSGLWLVAAPAGEPRLVPARGRVRDAPAGPPVTGDWVALDAGGAIAAVLERRGVIVRRAAGTTTEAQVLAANVDLALIVESLPDPNARRAERIASLASTGGVDAMVVLTKADLAAGERPSHDAGDAGDPGPAAAGAPLDPDVARKAEGAAWRLAERVGATDAVAAASLRPGGVEALRSRLVPGRTAVLLGPSGAGKSTLANALLGSERQATRPVRAVDGRGRHTTVTRELIPLPGGALLVDTPGLRLVRLWDGTGSAFGDIDELAARCRFADCAHETEPGCAVRDAVDPDRLAAWRKLAREQAWVDDRRAAERDRERRGRSYTRQQRAARRMKGGR